jgi:hypothetical protein
MTMKPYCSASLEYGVDWKYEVPVPWQWWMATMTAGLVASLSGT